MLLELHSRDRRFDRRRAGLDESVAAVFAVLQDVDVDGMEGTDAVDVDWALLAVAADAADCLGHC